MLQNERNKIYLLHFSFIREMNLVFVWVLGVWVWVWVCVVYVVCVRVYLNFIMLVIKSTEVIKCDIMFISVTPNKIYLHRNAVRKTYMYLPKAMYEPTKRMASRYNLNSIGRGYKIERTSVPFNVEKPCFKKM